MKIKSLLIAGGAALALATTAALASDNAMHHMTVRLPDGGTAQIAYTGSVAPRVTFDTAPLPVYWPAPAAFAPLADFSRIAYDMDRQMDLMLAQAQQMAAAPQGLTQAQLAGMPAGTSSFTYVSTGAGGRFCARSTEIAIGAGGKRQVHSSTSGDCAGAAADRATGTGARKAI
ncbi:MAG TPA: hypothetical protein VMH86_04240 [Rhizomicrobium sp.]|nr:hypothetical protein [Rhizomicrobium sp.]